MEKTDILPVSAAQQDSATPHWRSAEINHLALALVAAQAEIEDAPRSGNNQFKGYNYATISDIRAATKAPLANHGLAITQLPFTSADGCSIRLRSVLIHTSGQWIASELEARCEGVDKVKAGVMDMQKVGSALTYMRKYALSAMVGVAADDDDGQATANPQGQWEQQRGNGHQQENRRRQQSRRHDRNSHRESSQAQLPPPQEPKRDPDPGYTDAGLPPFREWLTAWVEFGNEWWIEQFDKREQPTPEGYPTLVNQFQISRHLFKWASAEQIIIPGNALPEKPSNAQIERLLIDHYPNSYSVFDGEVEHYIKKTRPAQVKDEIDRRAANTKQSG